MYGIIVSETFNCTTYKLEGGELGAELGKYDVRKFSVKF